MSKSPIVASFFVAFASITLSAQVHLGAVRIGSTTETMVTMTITNPGTLASISVVTGGAADIDFNKTGGGTCKVGKTYQAKETCTVAVKFSPMLAGTRQGGVSLADGNSNPMAIVYLKGDGLGPQAAFGPATQMAIFSNLNNVADLSVDASGNVYAAESETYPSYNPGAPEIPGGIFKATYGGSNHYTVSNIGNTLVDPVGVAVDGDGNVLEADAVLDSWISPEQGTVTSLPGFFHGEQSLAVDAAGNIYSAGYGSVYKSSPAFAATQTYAAVVTGLGDIRSIAVNGAGDLFIPNSGAEPAVYKETLTKDGYVQTQIGSGWVQPSAIAVDGNGIVYVNDSGTVYSETPRPDGSYSQSAILAGQSNGTSPGGLAVDGDGNLYVPVYAGAGPFGSFFNVDKFDRSAPPVLSFATTTAGSTSSDSPRTVTVSNLGTEPLQFYGIHFPAAFPESKQPSEGRCKADTTLAVGATCNIVIDFSPAGDPSGRSASQTITDHVEIFTNTLGAPGTRQLIPVTGTKTKEPTAQIPVISKPSGTYNASQTISFSDATPGAVIYYTLNGKTPTETTGNRYTGPGKLDTSATLKVIAYAPGYAPSPVVTATYRFTVARPTISPAGGSFKKPVTVTITGATPGATIYYTTTGNLPTTSSTVYTGPFTISGDEHVIAMAAKTGFAASAIVEQKYELSASQN